MGDILKSILGRRLGLDKDDNLVVKGSVITGGSSTPLAAGSTRTLTADDSGKLIALDTLAGSTVTLPAAVGSGAKYRFYVSVLATSNSHIVKVANSSDTMIGGVVIADTDTAGAASSFFAASTSDTITLNRSTTGSVSLGEYIEVEDIASTKWLVSAVISGTGTVATPFSATV
ncbi:hypothetical protein IVB27_32400 [Bradyrhizobium sp. 197]|uniref:hypothetical protein n=1 Tax=Bradyrhizobium sp. 197 TaxID=2782663 RepID=UPI001FF938D7|nr:hypothetical protein [Bradyrhizobium sp. 197]MCK1479316.1 hypothetical protein [Bradyrhizobium sp. 197]